MSITRTLKLDIHGTDVVEWKQVLLRDGLDLGDEARNGMFGPRTVYATKLWQAARGLAADGIVGPITRGMIGTHPHNDTEPQGLGEIKLDPIKFLQARYFTPGPRTAVWWVVIHSAEIGESLDGAEALQKICAENTRQASWHYAVDADSITQSVRETDVAWHAPGANRYGIGIELSGRAKQTRAEWLDPYSDRLLTVTAWLVAGICKRWGIPLEYVDEQGLQASVAPKASPRKGVTMHSTVSKAFKQSDHWDPGPGFPMDVLLERARGFNGG